MWYAIGGVVVAIIVFLVWRITSVGRGASQRDEKIIQVLDPIANKLSEGAEVSTDEITALCQQYELRPMLYNMLKHFERLDLFSEQCVSMEKQAEGLLAQWMMHPNELQTAPETIECVKCIEKDLDGTNGTFVVLKYKMPAGHWAGQDWLLGLAGPFFKNDVPYAGPAGSFSRGGDKEGSIQPEELVDWYVNMCRQKAGEALGFMDD